LKDYFDLDVLLTESDVTAEQLRRSIEATFSRRQMALPQQVPAGLSNAFATDPAKQAQWKAFLKKNRLPAVELADLVVRLRDTLLGTLAPAAG
jgi:hypothetical protein